MSFADFLLDFLTRDVSPHLEQPWLLDDESGAPYTPLRLVPSFEQMGEWQAELATAINALAGLEDWSPDWRREILANVLLELGLTLPYSIRTVRELVRTRCVAPASG